MRIYDDILNEMKEKYKELTGCEVYESSDIGIRLRVLAGEIFSLYARLDYIEKQSFYATASGEYLDKHAEQYGIKRKQAAKSIGSLTFTIDEALDYILYIPEGSVCALGDSLRYVTTESCRISPGFLSVTAPAEAECGGIEYNCPADSVATAVNVPAEISLVNNPTAFSGGTETESDEELRERLITFCSFLPSGANEEFYKEIAYLVDGIESVSVTSSAPGAADVYVFGKTEAVPDSAIEALKELYEAKKNIGTTVNVQNASTYAYSVYLDISPDSCSFQTARQSVVDAISEYFSKLNIGDPVYKERMAAYLLENTPIKNLRFPSALSDYAGSPSVMPLLSGAEVGEM